MGSVGPYVGRDRVGCVACAQAGVEWRTYISRPKIFGARKTRLVGTASAESQRHALGAQAHVGRSASAPRVPHTAHRGCTTPPAPSTDRATLPGAHARLAAVTVAALFVDPAGVYPALLPGRLWWGENRDARLYAGPHPVVAHPPCHLWVNLAAVNWKRYGRQLPAWYPGGDDGGCFAAALAAVRKYGGVLEHPAGSHAWWAYGLTPPTDRTDPRDSQWTTDDCVGMREWTCEVWQSAYGHKARKRTWLLYCGARPPFELDWRREPGTHQCGWFDRNKPTVGKREASATPELFAGELIRLAEWSRGAP